MKLTALEIKQQKFDTVFRGYDPAEVEAFLNLMSNEWEHLRAKNRELQQKIDDMQEKLKHYERVEEALHETLQAAKDTAETKLEGAQKEADHKIEKAEMQAEAIVKDAKEERRQVRQSILRLLDRRKEIVAGIRSYLEVAKESVEQFDSDETRLYDRPEEREELYGSDDFSSSADTGSKQTENKKTSQAATSPPGTENIDELVDDLE